MTTRTSAAHVGQGINAAQTGIRQRSLRKHCRLGRATELVFITALGTAVMIGGGADAQSVTYTDGQDRTDFVGTTGNVDLTVNAGESATQSWVVSGAGNVTKLGGGTLTFSGANTYTGDNAITAGTLRVTNVNALGGTTGNTVVANGATLQVAFGADTILREGMITLNGTGVGGGGALRFSETGGIYSNIVLGSNASIVNVSSGTASIRGLFDAGDPEVTITGNDHDLTFGGTGRIIVRPDITLGTGLLIKTGSGRLDLRGDTSLSGTFAVNEGRVEFRSGGTLSSTGLVTVASGAQLFLSGSHSIGNLSGAGAVQVSTNGTLTLGDGSNQSFSGVISDGGVGRLGNLTKQGSGTLTLSGANTYAGTTTINAGTLQIGDGGTTGSLGTGNVVNNATFTFNRSDDVTVANVISGTGGVTKEEIGTLTLTGANTYSGTTTINAGRLAVDGSITSASTVNSGGTLGGTGTVGVVTVNTGGRLAAGNSIGTLNTSSVTLNAGSILEVEVDPSDAARADLINVTGDFTINGATLRHIGEAGTYVPDRTWRIVTTTGAVSGTFGTVASDYTFLTPTAIYGANFVDLRLVRNATGFDSVARTRNQRATARGIGTIAGSEVSNTLVTLSGDAARDALDQFSGAGLAAIGAGQLGEGQGMVNTLSGQMGGAGGGIVTASSRGHGDAPSRLWANLYGTGASRDVDGITTDLRNGGVMIGHDLDFGAWQGGVMVGFGQARTDTSGLRTTSETDSISLGTYAARRFGEMDVNLGLIGTWGDVQSTRTVAVGALNQTLEARYSTRMLTGFAEVAQRFDGAVWSATPFARLTQQWLHNDGFTETGGTAALTRAAQTTTQTLLTLGAEVERNLGIGTLSANAALTQSFGAGAEATYRLGNSAPFTVEGDAPRDTSLDLGLGYDIALPNNATLSLTANATRQGNATTRRVGLSVGMRF